MPLPQGFADFFTVQNVWREKEEMNTKVKYLPSAKAAANHLSLVAQEKSFSQMSDEELIVACQNHQPGAIDQLLKRHKSTIVAMIRRRAPEWVDTQDIVQEAYIRMWKSIDQLRSPAAFKGWLGQIVTNLYYDEVRRRVRNQDVISLDEPVESDDGSKKVERAIADTTTQPDKTFQRMELVQALGEALEKIPQQFRQSVLLREVDGLSYEEIAVITNTELGTVKSRISRARVKIQAQLAPYLKESA